MASTVSSYSNFGIAISMSNDGSRIVIGESATQVGSKKGAVYIYTRTGTNWTFTTKITADQSFMGVGLSVDITGDGVRIVTGNYTGAPSGINNAGNAYIFS